MTEGARDDGKGRLGMTEKGGAVTAPPRFALQNSACWQGSFYRAVCTFPHVRPKDGDRVFAVAFLRKELYNKQKHFIDQIYKRRAISEKCFP